MFELTMTIQIYGAPWSVGTVCAHIERQSENKMV